MKVKLSMPGRLRLLELTADMGGTYARLRMLREFQGQVSFGEEEQTLVGYSEMPAESGGVISTFANPEKDPMKTIEVGEIMNEYVCSRLLELERTNELKQKHMELYEQFVLPGKSKGESDGKEGRKS